jgi:anti-sigma regulatory factor (Ser/Thr protein kinase)
MTHVRLHFETEPVSLRMVRKQTAAAALAVGAPAYDAQKIELAVGEALANAYFHAYDGARGPVDLEIAYDGTRFAITVHDQGKGLPFEPEFPAPPDPAEGGGYGLIVIKGLMDEAQFMHPGPTGRGTIVQMAIRVK